LSTHRSPGFSLRAVQQLLDLNPVPSVLLDVQGSLQAVNASFLRLSSLRPGMRLSLHLADGSHLTGVALARHLEALGDGSTLEGCQLAGAAAGGLSAESLSSSRSLAVHLADLGQDAGRFVLSFFEDDEREYRNMSEGGLLALAREVPLPLCITTQAEGAILFANAALRHMFGFDEQLPDHITTPNYFADPTERSRAMGELQKAGFLAARELRLVRRDGQPFLAVVHARAGSFRGKPCFFSAFQDITAQREQEERLIERQALLEAIGESTTQYLEHRNFADALGVLLEHALRRTDSEYGFIGAVLPDQTVRVLCHRGIDWHPVINRAFYEQAASGYAQQGYLDFPYRRNLLGHTLDLGMPYRSNEVSKDPHAGGIPKGHPPLHRFLGIPLRTGEQTIGMIGLANRPRPYGEEEEEVVAGLLRQAAVLCLSYLRTLHEKSLEEQVLQAQKMESIGRLAGGVAHDFNNLLTIIMGYTDLLRMETQGQTAALMPLNEIQRASERARDLTRQLLAFARRQMVSPQVLDLNQLVERAFTMLGRLVGEQIQLKTLLTPGLWPTRLDPGQMEQVIINLCVNAIDAMAEGGELVLETANLLVDQPTVVERPDLKVGEYVLFSVRDSGSGIPPELLSKVFEPFFTTKPVGRGTGLGLSTVYGIVSQFQGSIWVESEPGKGTTFYLAFPRSQESLSPEADRITGTVPTGKESLLVLEDEQPVQQMLSRTLANAGYFVQCAGCADEALELAARYDFDFLVADVVLPGPKGPEVFAMLKKELPKLGVLYVSGYGHAAGFDLSRATPLLAKPFSSLSLLKTLRTAINRQARPSQAKETKKG
jgi:signal transduction histidine kinase/ActR/RegA family two-component response regulator